MVAITSNVWAGYSPRLLRARYAPATRPLRTRYAPATGAIDLHLWFSQDEEVFTQQVK